MTCVSLSFKIRVFKLPRSLVHAFAWSRMRQFAVAIEPRTEAIAAMQHTRVCTDLIYLVTTRCDRAYLCGAV